MFCKLLFWRADLSVNIRLAETLSRHRLGWERAALGTADTEAAQRVDVEKERLPLPNPPAPVLLASHDLGCLGESLHVGGGARELHGHVLLHHLAVVNGCHGDSRRGHSPGRTGRERMRP